MSVRLTLAGLLLVWVLTVLADSPPSMQAELVPWGTGTTVPVTREDGQGVRYVTPGTRCEVLSVPSPDYVLIRLGDIEYRADKKCVHYK